MDLNCDKNGYYNCEICKDGFILNFYDICVDPFCQVYENGKCLKCNRGFELNSRTGNCERITNIGGGGGSTTTIITVKNITKSESSSKTVITESNSSSTTVITTTIVGVSAGCLLFKPKGGCHRCLSSFFLSNGLCQGVDKFCEAYDPENGTCLICKPSYQLINSRCISSDPSENCLIFEKG